MTRTQYNVLTDEQIEHFMRYGFVRIENCFTPEQAAQYTSNVWTRLGFDADDKSTWTRERTNMPQHRTFPVADFAPKAWGAICELVGGEERVADYARMWSDSLIVNLGSEEFEGKSVDPRELVGWHVDGDFFVHFLDSPEQGLLVIPLFTDIQKDGGGTLVCSDAMGKIANYLYEHPDGVYPRMSPRDEPMKYEKNLKFYNDLIQTCSEFHEMTGKIGDVVLLHPLMCHSASRNSKRNIRIITNPPVALKQPFCFDREDGDYSLVEKKTMALLGKERLPGWKITGERAEVVPERVRLQKRMLEEEKQRLALGKENVVGKAVSDPDFVHEGQYY